MNFAKKSALTVVSIAAIAFAPLSRAHDTKPAETAETRRSTKACHD